MKSLSLADLLHLQEENQSWAVCWMVTDRIGNVLRQTSYDRDIVVDKVGYAGTYVSTYAIQSTTVNSASDLAVDNFDMDALLEENGITQDRIRAGLFDNVRFTILLVNASNPTNSGIIVKSGVVGNIRAFADELAQAEGRGLKSLLQQTIIETYSLGCRFDLGDSRCGVNLALYTATGTVTSIGSARLEFTASGLAQAASYFDRGKITFTSGNNDDFSREVKRHQAGGVLSVIEPWPRDVQVGDTFTVHAGCNHMHQVLEEASGSPPSNVFGDCYHKFNNVRRYGGFPFMPGNNEIMRGVK